MSCNPKTFGRCLGLRKLKVVQSSKARFWMTMTVGPDWRITWSCRISGVSNGAQAEPKDPEFVIAMISWELEKMLAGYKANKDRTTHRKRL